MGEHIVAMQLRLVLFCDTGSLMSTSCLTVTNNLAEQLESLQFDSTQDSSPLTPLYPGF